MFEINLCHRLTIFTLKCSICLDHITTYKLFSMKIFICDIYDMFNSLADVWHFQVRTGRLQTQLCNSGTALIDLIIIFLVYLSIRSQASN